MKQLMVSIFSENEDEDRPGAIASLFDRLIVALNKAEVCSPKFGLASDANSLNSPMDFPRCLDLPIELRERVFAYSFQPVTIRLYTVNRDEVDIGRAMRIKNSQKAHQHYQAASAMVTRPADSRILFVSHRSARSIPLFHVCRASREMAKRRYGSPALGVLLFDPDIDSICHCGKWPHPMMPDFWHVFQINRQPVYKFKLIKSLQLDLFGFSTGTGLCLPPDLLLNVSHVGGALEPDSCTVTKLTSIKALKSISDSVTDITNLLEWTQKHVPKLEMLNFMATFDGYNGPASTNRRIEFLSRRKLSLLTELVNLRTFVVSMNESRANANEQLHLPRLKALSVQVV